MFFLSTVRSDGSLVVDTYAVDVFIDVLHKEKFENEYVIRMGSFGTQQADPGSGPLFTLYTRVQSKDIYSLIMIVEKEESRHTRTYKPVMAKSHQEAMQLFIAQITQQLIIDFNTFLESSK